MGLHGWFLDQAIDLTKEGYHHDIHTRQPTRARMDARDA